MTENEKSELEIEDLLTEEDEVQIEYDITTYPSDFTLWGIFEMWQNKDITIPDFQRGFVWTIRQSSLLIESFLLGLPVPPVFFYIDEENKNLVIDGQQRIMSIVFYFDGYFGIEDTRGKRQLFRLKSLDPDSPYSEKRFAELDATDQRKLKQAVLRALNVRQLSPSDDNTSIYHIFERLNTGGTPLKAQEIRNCVFRGDLVGILRELNKNKNWRSVLGKVGFDKHQKDVELVLRILSLSNNVTNYEKPMKEFLNRTMKQHRTGKTEKVLKFSDNFCKTAELIVAKLGSKPFHIRGPLNASALDSIFCTIMDNPNNIPNDLKERYMKLCENSDFLMATRESTSDTSVLRERFSVVKKILLD